MGIYLLKYRLSVFVEIHDSLPNVLLFSVAHVVKRFSRERTRADVESKHFFQLVLTKPGNIYTHEHPL